MPEPVPPPSHPIPKDSKDSKDAGDGDRWDRRDRGRRAHTSSAAERSESPSPWRCRPPGYSLKRRAVASAVATALDAVDMARRNQRAKRITLVA